MKTISVPLLAIAAITVPFYAQPFGAAQSAPPKTAAAPASTARKATTPATPAISRALMNPALLKSKAPDIFRTRLTTTKGDFVIEVHRDWSPLGADRFYNLVKNGFYNNAHFFRVVPGFVVQFGLSPSPSVNKVWKDTTIQDDPVKQTNAIGTVTFASRGPNTRTSQLFINLGDNARLDEMGFSPFGKITEGMGVVEKLYAGYGESPDQGRIQTEGKPYLDKNFSLLDSIKLARVEGLPAARPAARKSVPPAAKSTAPPASK
ncbi:MAG: peptidylprolyl isomerase [Terracidiphilus sp.]|jgi:peptidyl-prolyl cis-trans isomerase A (cyclophilin A)